MKRIEAIYVVFAIHATGESKEARQGVGSPIIPCKKTVFVAECDTEEP